MDFFEFKEEVFKKALDLGFSECEVFYSLAENLNLSVFKGELEKFQNNSSRGVSFRGCFNGKMGYAYTENLNFSSIDSLLKKAYENALIISDEEKEIIFSGDESYPFVKTFYEDIENVTVDEMLEKCLEMEREILQFSDKITNCGICKVFRNYSESFIANTNGVFLENKANMLVFQVSAIAKLKETAKSFGDTYICYDFSGFDHRQFAKNVAKKVIKHLGAISLKSGFYKVVIENECFADFLDVFVSNFYAENVQRGLSLLQGKLGQNIASDKVTILDNPLLEGGYSSVSFDSEGVASFNKVVVENGVLQTYLYNLKSAKKDCVKSTGNGFKASYKGTISTSATNFYLQNGDCSFDEVLQNVGTGVFITSVSGLHSGANSISGDFSLLAEGFFIENSKISYPLEQITIAGNFYDVLKNVQVVANDLKFNTGAVGSPTVFVGELSISGE